MRWQELLDGGEAESAADIARDEGLTRARVSQLMRLLKLAPEIREAILDPDAKAALPTEKTLRELAGLTPAKRQVKRFQVLVEREGHVVGGRGRGRGRGSSPRSRVRRKGFQHLFDRARRYQDMLEREPSLSLAEIGRREGCSGARVSQVLLMLQLAPEIIDRVDVPAPDLPEGVTERRLRKLARCRHPNVQVQRFGALLRHQPPA